MMTPVAGPSRLGLAARQVTKQHLSRRSTYLVALNEEHDSLRPRSGRLAPHAARSYATGSALNSETKKKTPRYNFNTSLSFSDDPDPDVRPPPLNYVCSLGRV